MPRSDEYFLKEAYKEALKAYNKDEVPVGCVIVFEDKIIARGHNTRELKQNILHHAELNAIAKACKKQKTWRLENCTIYITLEPCPMCAGAIIASRIKKMVYGAKDPKQGANGSVLDLFHYPFNHRVEITKGVMEEECKEVLKDFFRKIRLEKK